jgi:DNA-binding LytR/AlgR family response regulator
MYHDRQVEDYQLALLSKPTEFSVTEFYCVSLANAAKRFYNAQIVEIKELKKITQVQPNKINDHFFIKCDSQIEKVFYNDLVYAEAMLNYVMLYTNSRKMMVYVTIKSLEGQLPADIFIKVHKSFIVNINKIKSIEGNILDIGNEKITISQNLLEKVISEIVKDKLIKR